PQHFSLQVVRQFAVKPPQAAGRHGLTLIPGSTVAFETSCDLTHEIALILQVSEILGMPEHPIGPSSLFANVIDPPAVGRVRTEEPYQILGRGLQPGCYIGAADVFV